MDNFLPFVLFRLSFREKRIQPVRYINFLPRRGGRRSINNIDLSSLKITSFVCQSRVTFGGWCWFK